MTDDDVRKVMAAAQILMGPALTIEVLLNNNEMGLNQDQRYSLQELGFYWSTEAQAWVLTLK